MKDPLLPPAPESEQGPVKAWSQAVVMPTYLPGAPDRNPMFLEKRVYQGSSGKVYPLPFIDRIATQPVDHAWQAIHLENEFLRIVILPEIGGRIHIARDKINGYDFVYRQDVIKPSLVGLAGPWISGGIEFNWPQHHRPATFMPVQTEIERAPDGSVTVWCSDHDPMSRMKGMHGVRLSPGSSLLEIRVRLYNRTETVQTFLWWANIAARVHEHYQSFFPGDVRFIADHARRAITSFPLSDRTYYGIDYPERALHGVPQDEAPRLFRPDGSYAANDLSWYANIPVPTSYMVTGTQSDFFGGYDHAREAGFVHVANHYISPGKKQWTWGNHEFGYAWDRNLTDTGGPYIELMAGVYTDNQPDFSWLVPGETRAFSQLLFPIRDLGIPIAANTHAAIGLTRNDAGIKLSLAVTTSIQHAQLTLSAGTEVLSRWRCTVQPQTTFHAVLPLSLAPELNTLAVTLQTCDGVEILRYDAASVAPAVEPIVAVEPLPPERIASQEELLLTGQHLAQYRHATRSSEPYWREALRRDPEDSRANNAIGLWHLQRGGLEKAAEHFRVAIARLTRLNPNPSDGEPFYNLGLALRLLDRDSEVYAAFYKATWNAAWSGAAYHKLAEIDIRQRHWTTAFDHLQRSLNKDQSNLTVRNLTVVVLRQLDRNLEASALLRETRALDPLDIWARHLDSGAIPEKGQDRLDLAFDYARSNLFDHAIAVLSAPCPAINDGSAPMAFYALSSFYEAIGDKRAAEAAIHAASLPGDYVFPSRTEELLILERIIASHPEDSRAPLYLGNLLYDRRRHEEAMLCWERAVALDPTQAVAHRNLGIAYFNIQSAPEKALASFDHAVEQAPSDGRLIYERDQLRKRIGWAPNMRLHELERSSDAATRRDDIAVELASLYNHTGMPEKALTILGGRIFQPWEGGESLVLGQYVRANLLCGQRALRGHNTKLATQSFLQALQTPASLGEAKHLLSNESDIYFWLGRAYSIDGEAAKARHWWKRATMQCGDFQQMFVQTISEMTFWTALAHLSLGEIDLSRKLFHAIDEESRAVEARKPEIDYFATSLPAMLLFDDDLARRHRITALFMRSQALLGLGRSGEARQLLGAVLQLDVNHAGANDLLENLPLLELTSFVR